MDKNPNFKRRVYEIFEDFFTRTKRYKQNLIFIRDSLKNDMPLKTAFVERLLEDKKKLKEIRSKDFLIFSYETCYFLKNHNIGDFIQSIATKNALKKCFKEPSFKYVNRDKLFYETGGGLR